MKLELIYKSGRREMYPNAVDVVYNKDFTKMYLWEDYKSKEVILDLKEISYSIITYRTITGHIKRIRRNYNER